MEVITYELRLMRMVEITFQPSDDSDSSPPSSPTVGRSGADSLRVSASAAPRRPTETTHRRRSSTAVASTEVAGSSTVARHLSPAIDDAAPAGSSSTMSPPRVTSPVSIDDEIVSIAALECFVHCRRA